MKIRIRLPKIDLRKITGTYDLERKLRQEKTVRILGKEIVDHLLETKPDVLLLKTILSECSKEIPNQNKITNLLSNHFDSVERGERP